MTSPERFDLAKERGIGDLLGDSINLYFRFFPTLFAISLGVVVPVLLVVAGIGLEELSGGYRESGDTAEMLIPTLVSYFVIGPLITAAVIHLLTGLSAGARPGVGSSIQAGLDVFAPLFLAVVIAGVGIAAGLALLILPGIFLAIRWYFVAQAVMIDGLRSTAALRSSWAHSQGFWWRTLAVVVLANIVVFLPASLIVLPLESLAESADKQWISLAATILTASLTAPFVALVSTLLFYDIRARRQEQLSFDT